MALVLMNAQRIDKEKYTGRDGTPALGRVIYKRGWIYDVPEALAKTWRRLHIAYPVVDGKVTLRCGETKTLSPAKVKSLTRAPLKPDHPLMREESPSLDDPEDEALPEPAPARKKKKTAKKTTTRKAAKKTSKKKSSKKK